MPSNDDKDSLAIIKSSCSWRRLKMPVNDNKDGLMIIKSSWSWKRVEEYIYQKLKFLAMTISIV